MKLSIKRGLLCLIPLAIFFILPSCRDCDPYSNPSSYAVGAFYDKNNPDQPLTTINFESVSGIGGADISPMSNGKYLLPLKITTRQTGFSFIAQGLADTTYIDYESSVKVNGPDCGAYEQLVGLGVSRDPSKEGTSSYSGVKGALFDSVIVVNSVVSADTANENVQFLLDVCDASTKSPSRSLIVSFFNKDTGEPKAMRFESIHVLGKASNPIYTSGDNFSTVLLPVEGDNSTIFEFEYKEDGVNISKQQMKVVFNAKTTISDDETGCVFLSGIGDIKLESGGNQGLEFTFANDSIFKKMQVDRQVINTNLDWPNVKLYN
ncbi:hypothetical protein [Flammeovirga kamogawensis]|uniref:DUF1735 domain-containing protein n=1 Tax=Flammeovirga kamogawensis TaxID=373891 RepID=A0ABX8GSB8_9BACT|nr:hypothetical protein [Flammeovirga kamogawensis]MBB6462937.1 hypothetical protein [Flammeovirga kamogawensis]QWG06465.1 hypothetical protein KM029_14145 [Flammeovirga kamogawensis]TRX68294.1 hypothetical protein EO216_09160 [Flammeovirga kamogawensis]